MPQVKDKVEPEGLRLRLLEVAEPVDGVQQDYRLDPRGGEALVDRAGSGPQPVGRGDPDPPGPQVPH